MEASGFACTDLVLTPNVKHLHSQLDNDMKYTVFKEVVNRLNEVEDVIEKHVNLNRLYLPAMEESIINLSYIHYKLESAYPRYTNKYYRDKLPRRISRFGLD